MVQRLIPSIFLIFFLLIFGLPSFAETLRLFTWRVGANYPALVLAAREHESFEQAAHRYVQYVTQHEELSLLKASAQIKDLAREHFAPLHDLDYETRTLLIANRPLDLIPDDWRVPSFADIFRQEGLISYVVPFAADAGLSAEESAQLVQMYNEKFRSFVAMGGDDIDLRQINDQTLHPQSIVNARRDQWEIALLRQKLQLIKAQGHGGPLRHRLLGVCRGAQLTAALMGYKIVTRVQERFTTSQIAHGPSQDYIMGQREPLHVVRLFDTTYSHLKKAAGDRRRAIVNSYHQQAIDFLEGMDLELAALSPDGVAEGFESKDGAIILKQFHAELMPVRNLKPRELARQRFGIQFMRAMAHFLRPSTELIPPTRSCSSLVN